MQQQRQVGDCLATDVAIVAADADPVVRRIGSRIVRTSVSSATCCSSSDVADRRNETTDDIKMLIEKTGVDGTRSRRTVVDAYLRANRSFLLAPAFYKLAR